MYTLAHDIMMRRQGWPRYHSYYDTEIATLRESNGNFICKFTKTPNTCHIDFVHEF